MAFVNNFMNVSCDFAKKLWNISWNFIASLHHLPLEIWPYILAWIAEFAVPNLFPEKSYDHWIYSKQSTEGS